MRGAVGEAVETNGSPAAEETPRLRSIYVRL